MAKSTTKLSGAAAIALIRLVIEAAPAGIEAIRAFVNKNEATKQDADDAAAQYDKDTFESLSPTSARLIAEDDAKNS